MAHECPACGLTCFCGGDIDDCVFNDELAVDYCDCCDEYTDDDWDEYEDM